MMSCEKENGEKEHNDKAPSSPQREIKAAAFRVVGPRRLACWLQGGAVGELECGCNAEPWCAAVEAARGAHLFQPVMLLVQTPVTWSASKMVFESAGVRPEV